MRPICSTCVHSQIHLHYMCKMYSQSVQPFNHISQAFELLTPKPPPPKCRRVVSWGRIVLVYAHSQMNIQTCTEFGTNRSIRLAVFPDLNETPDMPSVVLRGELYLAMSTYQSAEETPRCLQHKSPPPHSGRPLARLRHKRIDSHPHRTTIPNDNNSQTTSKCLRTHLPSATRHTSHRHSGIHPTFNMAPPKRTSTTPLGRPNRQ